MICLTLPRRVDGQSKVGRNCETQSKMCGGKESRGHLSARSSTRCIHTSNCSIASPLGVTLAMRKSRSSKRRSVSNNTLRKAKDPDLVRLLTRSPGRVGMPAKILNGILPSRGIGEESFLYECRCDERLKTKADEDVPGGYFYHNSNSILSRPA